MKSVLCGVWVNFSDNDAMIEVTGTRYGTAYDDHIYSHDRMYEEIGMRA